MSDQEAELIAAYERLRAEVLKLQQMEEENRELAETIARKLGIPLPDEPKGRHLKALGMVPMPFAVQKFIASASGHSIGLGAATAAATATLVAGGAIVATNNTLNAPHHLFPPTGAMSSQAPGVPYHPQLPSGVGAPGKTATPARSRPSPTRRAAQRPAPHPSLIGSAVSPSASPGPPSFLTAPVTTPTVVQGPSGGSSSPGTGPTTTPAPPSDTPTPQPPASQPPPPASSPPPPAPYTSPSSVQTQACLSVLIITACIS